MENLLFSGLFIMIGIGFVSQKIIESRKVVFKSILDADVYINITQKVSHKTVDKYPRLKPVTKMDIARKEGVQFYG